MPGVLLRFRRHRPTASPDAGIYNVLWPRQILRRSQPRRRTTHSRPVPATAPRPHPPPPAVWRPATHAVAAAEKAFGPIDILANNAGILSNNKIGETTPDEWHRVLGINLDGAFHLSRAVLPGMKARRFGRIVNTCSYAMKSGGLTAGTAYTVSKGALQALTFSLAREFAAFAITVNGIAPAYVKTPLVTGALTQEQRDALIVQVPSGRFC